MHGHRPSAVAARDVAEGGEGGRPHRCFPLPPGMPLRTVNMARAQARARRPPKAPTCRDRRMVHVDAAQLVLRRGREWAGGGNIVHARAYRHAGRPRLVPFGSPDASVGPASILRHGTTHAVNVWSAA